MSRLDTTFLRRCLRTLEHALVEIRRREPEEDAYDIYRAACVKEFELVLEQSGTLLRKRLAAFFASNRQVDRLAFKDLFRHAAKHRVPTRFVRKYTVTLRGRSLLGCP